MYANDDTARRVESLLPVVVVEPDLLARRALAALVVSHGFHLAAATGDAGEAFDVIRSRAVGTLLTEIVLPDMTLAEFLTAARGTQPGVRTVVVTGEEDGNVLADVLRTGVDAILSKYSPPAALMLRLACVSPGGLLLDENTGPPVREWLRGQADGVLPLPRREREVLELVLQGHSVRSAARELGLAESTVKSHAAKAAARLGMRTSRDAAAEARRRGLVTAPRTGGAPGQL